MTKLSTTKDIIYYCLPYLNGRVLDIGAGTAKYKPIFAEKISEYIACDTKIGKSIDVICNAENLSFAPESFDTAISTQVFEHVSNPFKAAKEIKKILKHNGYAIITAPFMVPFHSDPGDYFRFSKRGLEEIFKSIDFEIIDSGIYGGFFMVISEMIHFSWFNPYKQKKNQPFVIIEKIARILDKIFNSKIIYANTFVVVRKK